MRTLALSALLLLPAALGAQDDPLETHLYNVQFFTEPVADFPGEMVGIAYDAIGTADGGDREQSLLTGEDLVRLLRANVDEDSWEHKASAITFEGGVLTITNHKSTHAKIAQYLAYWRGHFGRLIVLDAAIVAVDAPLLARLRATDPADRPGLLSAETFRKILDAAREGKQAELIKSMRLTARSGQRVSLQELTQQSYVRDYDVQIATGEAELDPVVDVLSTGPSIDVRAFLEPFPGGITLESRLDFVELDAMGERILRVGKESTPLLADAKPAGPVVKSTVERKVQLPRVQHDRVRTMLTVRERESAVVASLLRKDRNLLFVLTPGIVILDEKPAPEPAFAEQRLLRFFDISPLTRGVQDFTGPRLELVGPSRGGGGPLTGATYTLDEPAHLMGPESVADLIRARIAPDSWGNKRNTLEHSASGMLEICQKPEVLREIEKYLASFMTARAQMITTESIVVGFRKGARADWEKELPALAPGGYFADDAGIAKLLEEAAKGDKVRLIDSAEVTGFPQQRVYTLRSRMEAYLQDYEPQVSSGASAMDPIIGNFTTGYMMNIRPHYILGTDQIAVDVRAVLATGELKEVDALGGAAGAIQTGHAKALLWNQNVVCRKGKYSLLALQTQGRGEDAEEVVVFVRARPNLLP